MPTPDSGVWDITAGPDGALWFTESATNQIGRINAAGMIAEFIAGSGPTAIAAGPDGALWFVESHHGANVQPAFGRITTVGVVTEFTGPRASNGPGSIAAGPDGALWFTEVNSKIGRITTGGAVTEFTVPTPNSGPSGITGAPDGTLWFTENLGNKIGRITTAGVVTEFTVPTPGSGPTGIAAGPDGALWFTENRGNKIGRITTDGVITEFTVPTADSGPTGIAAGSDGALWFTENRGNKIGRITTDGVITEFTVPTADSGPTAITAGPDGALWFTEHEVGQIGRITPVRVPCASGPTTLCLNDGRFKVQTQWTTPDGKSGPAQAEGLTSDTGYFWFFSPDNVEMVVKVVDGRAFNDRYWVFAGGLTNVHVVMTVTDTQTGAVRTYTNPQGVAFQPIQDTDAFFASTTAEPASTLRNEISETRAAVERASEVSLESEPLSFPLSISAQTSCLADATTLCLNSGRFKVQVQWATPQGQSGAGQAQALTSDTGYFWFFSSSNVEMVIKAVTGCTFNSRYWVFAGGLTNVNVVMTVTDTQTGEVRTYTNPQSTAFQPIQATNAFACP